MNIHYGHILIESEKDKGTVVIITLPKSEGVVKE